MSMLLRILHCMHPNGWNLLKPKDEHDHREDDYLSWTDIREAAVGDAKRAAGVDLGSAPKPAPPSPGPLTVADSSDR